MTQQRNKAKESDSIIKNHVIWSMGGGAIPIPFIDLIAVTAIQLDMIKQLARVYDVDYKETEGKAIVTALTGSVMANIGKRAVKFIPGIGSILGGVTMAVLSGASTYALGEVFAKHFETGGTFLDFDPSRLKKYYDEKFEKGKEIVEEMKTQKDTEVEEENKKDDIIDLDIIAKLKELGELKKEGIISEEEFETLKKKIINN